MSWAEVKKINSDLSVPLNELIDSKYRSRRTSSTVLGIPSNTTYTSQVISDTDTPLISIKGTGRIVKIIAFAMLNGGNTKGTILVSADNNIMLNRAIAYTCEGGISYYQYPILTDSLFTNSNGYYSVTLNISNNKTIAILTPSGSVNSYYGAEFVNYITNGNPPIIDPVGIPFEKSFDIKATQTLSDYYSSYSGLYVEYVLYD